MPLDVGREAPDFSALDSEGGTTKLSDFRGKNVLLVFYPMAFSGVCTQEFCTLRDENADLVSDDTVEVIGVSVDSHHVLREFKKAQGFQIRFVSDRWPTGAIAKQYGVFDEEKGVALRGTFLIDAEGVVRWTEVNPIPEARDQQAWRKALAELTA